MSPRVHPAMGQPLCMAVARGGLPQAAAGAWLLGVPLAPCSPASPQLLLCLSGC